MRVKTAKLANGDAAASFARFVRDLTKGNSKNFAKAVQSSLETSLKPTLMTLHDDLVDLSSRLPPPPNMSSRKRRFLANRVQFGKRPRKKTANRKKFEAFVKKRRVAAAEKEPQPSTSAQQPKQQQQPQPQPQSEQELAPFDKQSRDMPILSHLTHEDLLRMQAQAQADMTLSDTDEEEAAEEEEET